MFEVSHKLLMKLLVRLLIKLLVKLLHKLLVKVPEFIVIPSEQTNDDDFSTKSSAKLFVEDINTKALMKVSGKVMD